MNARLFFGRLLVVVGVLVAGRGGLGRAVRDLPDPDDFEGWNGMEQ